MVKEITPDGDYRIKDPLYKVVVYDKYLRNMRMGIRDLISGEIVPFTGFPVDQNNGTSLRAYYTDETTEVIYNRLIKPIEKSARTNDIQIYSGSLWTLHTTISDLRYLPGSTSGSYENILAEVANDPRIYEASARLENLEVTFDTLFGGNAIALAASHLPTQVLEARRQMTQIAKELGMGENDYANIVHITLARLAPNPTGTKGFYPFARDLMKLHHGVLHDPIEARISRVEVMTNQQMDQVHHASLIAAVLNSR